MDRLDLFDYEVNNIVIHQISHLKKMLIFPDFREEILMLEEVREKLVDIERKVRNKACDMRKEMIKRTGDCELWVSPSEH